MMGVCESVPDGAVCLQCGYSLRGLPEAVCPECGETFDPADPTTFKEMTLSPWWYRAARPPKAGARTVMILLTVALLLDISSPGSSVDFAVLCFTVPAVGITIVVLLVDYCVRLLAVRKVRVAGAMQMDPDHQRRHRWHWRVLPLCLALILAALVYPWPAWIRFHLSRPAFEAVVAREDKCRRAEVVGLYRATWERHSDGVVFFKTGEGLLRAEGFLYRPTNRPMQDSALIPGYPLGKRWFTGIVSSRQRARNLSRSPTSQPR